ncbi:MAG: hypothetical protein HUN04_11075 [Desulfobacter sp.]|nr:MAG: hypothetical protein HUN04_11075 [Desulfobacter sp.]
MPKKILPYDFDDDLMEFVQVGKGPDVRIRPFDHTAVVAGRGSDLNLEIHMEDVRAAGIPVYRRKGGGCSVVLDPGNLMVTLALPAPGIGGIRELFDSCTRWLIRGFRDLGIEGIYQDGVSDLALDGRKVAGSCFYRTKGAALYSAAVLVNADLDLIDRCLSHPPREPGYRRGRSHKDFLTRLDRFIPGLTAEGLARKFCAGPAGILTGMAA